MSLTARRLALILPAVAAAATAGCRDTTRVPMELVNNLVIIDTRVNGSRPLSFILDTGAGATVVDRGISATLGLERGARGSATTGGGEVEMAIIDDVRIAIDHLPERTTDVVAIDLAGLTAGLGRTIGGILGFDVFRDLVVEFDYEARAVLLHDPETFRYDGGGDILPITLIDQTPFVTVGVLADDGRWVNAMLELDTGQAGAMTLQRAFVERERVFAPGHPAVSISAGALLPGAVAAQVTRVAAVRLGSTQFERPVANVTPSAAATGTSEAAAGLLGADLLRRFRVIVDYSRSRLILEPTQARATSFAFDASGISLTAPRLDPPEYRVRFVIPNSPAANAGVQVADIIVSIGGRAAGSMTLDEIRGLLRQPGRMIALTLTRGGQTRAVTFTTRELV
jgi:hypothetical protein